MILSAEVSGLNNSSVVFTFGPFGPLLLPASVSVCCQASASNFSYRIGASLVDSPSNDVGSWDAGEQLIGVTGTHRVSVPSGFFEEGLGGNSSPFVVIPIDGRFAARRYLAVIVTEDNLGTIDGHVAIGYFARPFEKFDSVN